MMEPWRNWIPGVLSRAQMLELVSKDYIRSVDDPANSIDESSIDLTLSDEVYRLTEGSVKPFEKKHYLDTLMRWSLVKPLQPTESTYILEKSTTYLVKLREHLSPNLT